MAEDIELLVNTWIKNAFERGASDIHFEPDEDDKVRIRQRVDGGLTKVETAGEARKVLARLKVMASLDVNERSIPLDGRFNFGNGLDVRVSTSPCMLGEKVVLRLIDNRKLKTSIEDLGMSKKMLAVYQPLIESPNGLILHVGPTGSGKTTSLYAVLHSLNRPETNIQTVEDPVEYQLTGITQTQVRHDQGLSFPRVLRALLRQDPNVILVGEIRDVETAEIATEAALTGHLVLSTLHTNDSIGTIVRLLEMGIAPYCIAYAVRVVVAQRFVKRLCKACRRSVQPPEHVVKILGVARPIFQAEGCKECNRTGFSGRIPLFELLPMSTALRQAIYANANPDQLAATAAKNGQITLWQDGLEKVFAGATSLEEVLRAVKGVKQGGPAQARGPVSATARRPSGRVPAPAGARPAPRPGPQSSARPRAPGATPKPATPPG